MSTSITTDVSNWPMAQQIDLLSQIDRLEAEAVATNAVGIAPAKAEQASPVEIPQEVETTGWNVDAYVEVMKRLLSRHYVQAAAIAEAIKSGTGYVSRQRVYELGKYPQDRSLKGFTRPVHRFTDDLVDAGLLPEDAQELLRPDYDQDVKSFQRARGFFVPMEVVKIALEAKAESEKNGAEPAPTV